MFDYDTAKLEKKEFKVGTNGVLVRTAGKLSVSIIGADVQFLPGCSKKLPPGSVCLAQVDVIDGIKHFATTNPCLDDFWVKSPAEQAEASPCENPWLVVRNLETFTSTHNVPTSLYHIWWE